MVEARQLEDVRLVKEHVAEFRYRPAKRKGAYRVVVVWKGLEVYQGQQWLFDDARCFFYITNDEEKTAEEIVFDANDRCNQENLLAQLKGGVRSLTAPVDSLLSNWAYYPAAQKTRVNAFDVRFFKDELGPAPTGRQFPRIRAPRTTAGTTGCANGTLAGLVLGQHRLYWGCPPPVYTTGPLGYDRDYEAEPHITSLAEPRTLTAAPGTLSPEPCSPTPPCEPPS